MSKITKKEIAKVLIDLGCLELSPVNPFTYASGLKGPIYCDNRLVISNPPARNFIVQAFLQAINNARLNFTAVAGIATSGIPHAAWIADRIDMPMIYIRGQKKAHGRQNAIEGKVPLGTKIVLIEDLINQGKSSAHAYDIAKEAGLDPVACLSIVDYQFDKAKEEFKKRDCPIIALTDFEEILVTAKELGKLSDKDIESLTKWHQDPSRWKA